MRVTATEFYKKPGHYFDLVARGVTIEITRHGKVISTLNPPSDSILFDFDTEPSPVLAQPAIAQGFIFGAFTFGGVWQGMEPFEELELLLDTKLSIVHWFMSFEHAWDASLLAKATTKGRTALITWESNHIDLDDILAGRFDAYFISWAQGMRAFQKAIYLRPFPEMNGNWTFWHGQPDKLKLAWQHMHTLFQLQGATNVKWVWSPNITDVPNTVENKLELYYPSSDYVDVLALDGYNWGNSQAWSSWQSFNEVFQDAYERVALLGSQDIWITETASTEQGGDKAQWIDGMFASTRFPRLRAVIWFNQKKEADWRIDSSSLSLAAFQSGLSDLKLAGLAEDLVT